MKKGFTLVEFILYISIVGVILVSFMYYMIDISSSSTKSDAFAEVGYNGRVAMEKISREIRNAVDINVGASVFDTHPGALSLTTSNPNTNPTTINLSGAVLQIKRGAGPVLPLTTSKVEITKLIFSNLSQSGTPGNIKILLTIRYKNPQNIDEFNASTTLESSVSLRQ
ncbi:MAG: hypothetical protein AAB795_00270 [Patescibacteria group bacterium]